MAPESVTKISIGNQPTDVRFSLRSLLVAMALTAFGVPVMVAIIRWLPAESRVLAAAIWSSALLVAIAFFAYCAWRRYRAEQAAGRTFLQLTLQNYAPRSSMPLRFLAIALEIALMVFVMGVVAATTVAEAFKGTLEFRWDQPVGIVVVGLICGSETARLIWNRRVRICEHGMVWGRRFLPWTDIDLCNWCKSQGDRLVVELAQRTRVTLVVLPEQREAMDAVVQEKLIGAPTIQPA